MRLRNVRPVQNRPSTAGLLRHNALGSDAVYRVLHTWGSTVEVEVVAAPGLEVGARLHLTTAAAATMGLDLAGAGREKPRARSAARGAQLVGRGRREALGYLSRQVPSRIAPTDRAG